MAMLVVMLVEDMLEDISKLIMQVTDNKYSSERKLQLEKLSRSWTK